MQNSIKNLTLASVLTSLFIVLTIFAMSTGLAYGLYLDFAVPIFFVIVYLKCSGKYALLSGITSTLLVFVVIGDIAGALFMTQSLLLGLLCAYFMVKDSNPMEDIFFASILGSVVVLLVDLYTKGLTGFSLITEFQEMIKWFPNKDSISFMVYLLISFYVAGMCFCIYYISLIIAKRLRVLNEITTKKWFIFRNLRIFNSFLTLKRSTFYISIIYILCIELLGFLKIKIPFIYLNTILIIIEYIALYFLFRDCIEILKNYILSRTKNISYVRVFLLLNFILLCFAFKIQVVILSILSYLIDIKYKIRIKQKPIIDFYYKKLSENIKPSN